MTTEVSRRRPGASAPATTPFADRAETAAAHAQTSPLVQRLARLLTPDEVLASTTDLVRYATDASPYRMVPRVVVRSRGVEGVVALLRDAREHGETVTCRAGGTSLNGQSQTDGILLDMREHFTDVRVLDEGRRLECGPGVVLSRANARLVRHARLLGPDPASSTAATVGGVLANNASGMTCGTRLNAYRTVESVVVVLASGTVLDTGAPEADESLRATEPELYARLEGIRDDLRADTALAERILAKFSIKNTSGYRLDAFLEFDRPVDILTHLLVGSEGTLGVVVHTRWRTVEAGLHRTTGFLRFADVASAAGVVAALNDANAQAVELMDSASLRSLRTRSWVPSWIRALPDDATDAVVLVERRTNDPADLAGFEEAVEAIVGDRAIRGDGPLLTRDPAEAAVFWRMRSGMLATVGAARPAGTALITEDVVVPPARLPEAVADLQDLLERHGFTGAVNGHASAGNMHFYVYLDATTPAKVDDYRAFMTELVDLVVDRYDGSLKGEHGTGRNMTAFIAKEWGERAMGFMWRIKRALDPTGLFAPGVFLDTDPDAPFRHLKSMPLVHPSLDPCIECGFCEPVCPSRHVTTTPRQRISLHRELARQGFGGEVADRLAAEYAYDAVETCAGDSSCAIACPVDIDTGAVMKEHREGRNGPLAQRVGVGLAQGWGPAQQVARIALGMARLARPLVGDAGLGAVTGAARSVGGADLVPQWVEGTPGPAPALPATTRDGAEAVLFPACINRIFGASPEADEPTTVPQALVALAERAGHPVWIPSGVGGLCCGTVWHSKGLGDGEAAMAARVVDAMWEWSDAGRLPIVVDASSCTLGLSREVVGRLDADRRARHERLNILDAMTFVRRRLVPDLPEADRADVAVVHPTCSMHTLGLADELGDLAAVVADEVYVPPVATCCGFAGDRGMLHPELTESATAEEAGLVAERLAADPARRAVFVSGNRTCELGLEHATSRPYEHVVVTLERATRS